MITSLPAVQAHCSRIGRGPNAIRCAKRTANRRHRKALDRSTRRMILDPERWWDEGFNAPSLSDWELD